MLPLIVSVSNPDLKPDPDDLLRWYDRHRRDLPWRAKPHEQPDPYRIWLSEIMLQQTTVIAVKPYFERFLQRFPALQNLAEAPVEQVMTAWAGLGYYSRARNLHACANVIMKDHAGQFPDTYEALLKLPGIGSYTAGAIAAIAFDRQVAAVDGNVERVISRLYSIQTPLPQSRPHIRTLTEALVPADRPGDFAQSLMDLGSTICTPRKPACVLCPWRAPCVARINSETELYPKKVPKTLKVPRFGSAFVVERKGGEVLLRTRVEKGLLNGMAEVPTSAWATDYDPLHALLDAPLDARWKPAGTVRHVFTHFSLELTIFKTQVSAGHDALPEHRWVMVENLDQEPLSTLMKNVLRKAGLKL